MISIINITCIVPLLLVLIGLAYEIRVILNERMYTPNTTLHIFPVCLLYFITIPNILIIDPTLTIYITAFSIKFFVLLMLISGLTEILLINQTYRIYKLSSIIGRIITILLGLTFTLNIFPLVLVIFDLVYICFVVLLVINNSENIRTITLLFFIGFISTVFAFLLLLLELYYIILPDSIKVLYTIILLLIITLKLGVPTILCYKNYLYNQMSAQLIYQYSGLYGFVFMVHMHAVLNAAITSLCWPIIYIWLAISIICLTLFAIREKNTMSLKQWLLLSTTLLHIFVLTVISVNPDIDIMLIIELYIYYLIALVVMLFIFSNVLLWGNTSKMFNKMRHLSIIILLVMAGCPPFSIFILKYNLIVVAFTYQSIALSLLLLMNIAATLYVYFALIKNILNIDTRTKRCIIYKPAWSVVILLLVLILLFGHFIGSTYILYTLLL